MTATELNPTIHPDIAMLYNHGLSIVWTSNGRKAGGGPDWAEYQDRRPTIDEVNEWFKGSSTHKRGQRRNVFVVCGNVSDLVGVDCDSSEAVEWFEQVLRANGYNPSQVPTVVTPSGNLHFYMSLGGRTDVAGFKVALNGVECIDVQANGRGLAAPPSVFTATSAEIAKGKRSGDYAWMPFRSLDDLGGLPTISDEVLEALRDGAVKSASTSEVVKVSTAEPKGEGWHRSRLAANLKAIEDATPEVGHPLWSNPSFGSEDDLFRYAGDLGKIAYGRMLLGEGTEFERSPEWVLTSLADWNSKLNGGVQAGFLGPHPDETVHEKATRAWQRAAEDFPPVGEPRDLLANVRPAAPPSVPEVKPDRGGPVRHRDGSGLLSEPLGDGRPVLTAEFLKDGESYTIPIANFGVNVVAVAYDPVARSKSFYCHFIDNTGKETVNLVSPEVYKTAPTLHAWLAGNGLGLDQTIPNKCFGHGSTHQRFVFYLHEQDHVPVMKVQGHYGRVEGSKAEELKVLTDKGVFTPNGLIKHEDAGVIPSESLMLTNAFHYGDGDPDEAIELLGKIATLKLNEREAAVTLAWLLMTQVNEFLHVKHKPMLVIIGESDSGKTTGLNDLATKLIGGSTLGAGAMTKATCRDLVASNAIGVVWLDEADDFEHLMPIALGASAGSSETKKANDNTTNVTVKLRGNIMTTSEVMPDDLKATSGQNRTIVNVYRKDPEDQAAAWPLRTYDELMVIGDGLTEYAGSILQLCLQWWRDNEGMEVYHEIADDTPNPTTRYAMNLIHLRLGGRMLSGLLGDPKWSRIVDEYCGSLASSTVTPQFQQMVVTVINNGGYVVDHREFAEAKAAIIIDEDEGAIWIDPKHLEASWGRTYQGRRSSTARKNKGSDESITYELCSALGVPKLDRRDRSYARDFYVYRRDEDMFNKLTRQGNVRRTFYRLPEDLCQAILTETSLSIGEGDEIEGLF